MKKKQQTRATQRTIQIVPTSLPPTIEAAFFPMRGNVQHVALANSAHPTRTLEQCAHTALDLALRNAGRE